MKKLNPKFLLLFLWIPIYAQAHSVFQDFIHEQFKSNEVGYLQIQARVLLTGSIPWCPSNNVCYYQVSSGESTTVGLHPTSNVVLFAELETYDLTITFDTVSETTTTQLMLYKDNIFQKEFIFPQSSSWTQSITKDELLSNHTLYFLIENNSVNNTTIRFSFTFNEEKSPSSPKGPIKPNNPGSSPTLTAPSDDTLSSNGNSNGTENIDTSSPDAENSNSTSSPIIVAIVFGVIAVVVFIMLFVGCFFRTRRRTLRVAPSDHLTPENLDSRFPPTKLEELHSSFLQTTCTICLEDLKREENCRQLYCEHIFHEECAKLWLINQLSKGVAFCPNCTKSVLKPVNAKS